MSDLSRLLEDVYRSGAPAAAAPSWASDAALDEVFADWVPGPPPEAPEAERAYANTPDAADELAAALDLERAGAPVPVDPFEPLQALLEATLRRAPDDLEPDAELGFEFDVDLVQSAEPEPEPEPDPIVFLDAGPEFLTPTPVRGWCRADDDILPAGKGRRSLFRRR